MGLMKSYLYGSLEFGFLVPKPHEARDRERGEYCLNEAHIIDQHIDILYDQQG